MIRVQSIGVMDPWSDYREQWKLGLARIDLFQTSPDRGPGQTPPSIGGDSQRVLACRRSPDVEYDLGSRVDAPRFPEQPFPEILL